MARHRWDVVIDRGKTGANDMNPRASQDHDLSTGPQARVESVKSIPSGSSVRVPCNSISRPVRRHQGVLCPWQATRMPNMMAHVHRYIRRYEAVFAPPAAAKRTRDTPRARTSRSVQCHTARIYRMRMVFRSMQVYCIVYEAPPCLFAVVCMLREGPPLSRQHDLPDQPQMARSPIALQTRRTHCALALDISCHSA